jgi:hypothetical protein
MQDLQSYLDTKLEADDEFVVPPHKSPEDLLDQFGLMASEDDAMHRAANRGSMGS